MKNISSFKWHYYLGYFFISSFVGWVYELGWMIYLGRGFVNRGFLSGYYLPVYGFGALVLLLFMEKLIKKKVYIGKVNVMPVISFLLVLLLVSTVELLASYFLEIFTDKKYWDYSKVDKIHFQGRVSLRNSSLLATGGMIFLYILYPLLNKLFGIIKPVVLKILTVAAVAVMFIDFLIVVVK